VRLPFPVLRPVALAGALLVTLVATGVPAPPARPVWLSGAQTAAGYTDLAQAAAGQATSAEVGTVIEAVAGAGHALGWQTAGGKGSTSRLWRSAVGATFSSTGTPDVLTVSATDPSATAWVKFTPPSGRVLEPATTFASGDGSKLEWSERGTCAYATHAFTISTLTWAADGTLTSLDATFSGSCGTSAKGRVLINIASLPEPATAAPIVKSVRLVLLRVGRKSVAKVAVTGTVTCGGSARVTMSGRILQDGRQILFTVAVDCTSGSTLPWTAYAPAAPLQTATGTYWLTGSVIDGFYRYSGDVLVKDKPVTITSRAGAPTRTH